MNCPHPAGRSRALIGWTLALAMGASFSARAESTTFSLRPLPSLVAPSLSGPSIERAGRRSASLALGTAKSPSDLLKEIDYYESEKPGLFLPIFAMVLGAPFLGGGFVLTSAANGQTPAQYLGMGALGVGLVLVGLGVISLVWRLIERVAISSKISDLENQLDRARSAGDNQRNLNPNGREATTVASRSPFS